MKTNFMKADAPILVAGMVLKKDKSSSSEVALSKCFSLILNRANATRNITLREVVVGERVWERVE